jgi:hypothetical protein
MADGSAAKKIDIGVKKDFQEGWIYFAAIGVAWAKDSAVQGCGRNLRLATAHFE